jgi:hypothetical protein
MTKNQYKKYWYRSWSMSGSWSISGSASWFMYRSKSGSKSWSMSMCGSGYTNSKVMVTIP